MDDGKCCTKNDLIMGEDHKRRCRICGKSPMTIESLKYWLGQIVTITELKCKGRIKSIWITETGAQYQVRYFDNAEAKTVYFYGDEIEEV